MLALSAMQSKAALAQFVINICIFCVIYQAVITHVKCVDVTPGLVSGYPLAVKHNVLTELREWHHFTRNVRENGITITFANIKLPRLTLSNLRVPLYSLLHKLPPITLQISLA